KVRVEPDKLVYRGGEPIHFTGEVYFADFEPLENADVRVHVSGDSLTRELRLKNAGDGKYSGDLTLLNGGDYVFHAEAVYDNRSVGIDSGRFAVEPFNLEFLNTRLNEPLLRKLAVRTDGHYLPSTDMDSLEYYLDFPEEKIAEYREIELWNKLVLLVVTLILLATEWYIRKKKGML
ncbi:hypothetical protein KAH55_06280, partial [bacterium]|nr:hypothetical protein [bacterium]